MTTYSSFPPPRRPSALPAVFAGAAFALAAYLVLDRAGMFTRTPNAEPRAVTARGELAPMEQNFVEVFERCSPSVAHITTRTLVRSGFGFRDSLQEGTGSGFVWDDRGTVVTNWHVVQGARAVRVAFGERSFTADLVKGSPAHDLAVLRLRGDVSLLKPLQLGTSKSLRVGQVAIAIGNPFGFDQTLTTGVVSALDRNIRTREGTELAGLIQVDAAVNPGNSGGPLLDSAGLLIGVTTAIYSPSGASAGLGFAVPVDTVNEIVPQLLASLTEPAVAGAADPTAPPRLGVENPSGYGSCRVDVPGFQSGAIFTAVTPGLGAEQAGLRPFTVTEDGTPTQPGDVIVAIDNRRVRTFEEIGEALRGRRSGQKVTLHVVRGWPDRQRLEQIPVVLGRAAG
jgi:S1-C subfamily serine protease